MTDPIDDCAESTRAINCWVAIKSLGTPTVAEIVTELTATLSNDPLDNLTDIHTDYVTSGTDYLVAQSLVTTNGTTFTIPDPSRFIRRVGDDLGLVPEILAFRNGYHW